MKGDFLAYFKEKAEKKNTKWENVIGTRDICSPNRGRCLLEYVLQRYYILEYAAMMIYLGNCIVNRVRWSSGSVSRLKVQ
jgi:hypothetical protein